MIEGFEEGSKDVEIHMQKSVCRSPALAKGNKDKLASRDSQLRGPKSMGPCLEMKHPKP